MTCPVAHSYGQLQLELPGVQPLTVEEVASDWLEGVADPWSDVALGAFLLVDDARSRPIRIARRQWVHALHSAFPEAGFGIVGGPEAMWLYYQASYCYMEGLDLAAMLCAHASCERELAAFLDLRQGLDARLQKAGLGPIAEAAYGAGFIDAMLLKDLRAVNTTRKVTAHFKPPLDPASIHRRLNANDLEDYEASLDALFRTDAEQALATATRVLLRLNDLPCRGTGPAADQSSGTGP